jgi:FRG domain-containing protein
MSKTQRHAAKLLPGKQSVGELHGTSVPLGVQTRSRNGYKLLSAEEVRRVHKVPLAAYATVLAPTTVRQILGILRSAKFQARASGESWVFRSQNDESWGLQSSIERLLPVPNLRIPDFGTAETLEQVFLLRQFKRRAHHYIPDLPDKEDDLEWLALMQHYGAPTRLLDCTMSPYVAMFFAVTGGLASKASAVWEFHLPTLRGQAYRTVTAENPKLALCNLSEREHFRNVLIADQREHRCHPFVFPVEPFRMNERLTAQQGRFLCPRTIRVGFETNLKVALADAATRPNLKGPRLYKIIVPASARLGLLEELDKMNINFATLFPGLEGFARSLRTQIELQYFRSTRVSGRTTTILKDLFKDQR